MKAAGYHFALRSCVHSYYCPWQWQIIVTTITGTRVAGRFRTRWTFAKTLSIESHRDDGYRVDSLTFVRVSLKSCHSLVNKRPFDQSLLLSKFDKIFSIIDKKRSSSRFFIIYRDYFSERVKIVATVWRKLRLIVFAMKFPTELFSITRIFFAYSRGYFRITNRIIIIAIGAWYSRYRTNKRNFAKR